MRFAICVLVVVGCGKKTDPCEQLVKQMPQVGTVEKCKAHIDELRKDPGMRCILDATDDDAVVACLRREAKELESASEADSEAAQAAERGAQQAINSARTAKDALDKASRDLDEVNVRVEKAIRAVADAQTEADRASANMVLRQLQQEQAEMRNRIEGAKQAAEKAERAKGVHIRQECLDNPLAKGC